jgi:two-component system CheB/CheR fusion protein
MMSEETARQAGQPADGAAASSLAPVAPARPEPAALRSEDGRFPIVGIGASAGGIDALQRFFRSVRPGSGIAYVVIQHLDPGHPSVLAELLARCTTLPVTQIAGTTEVEPDCVYIIPPNAGLAITRGRLSLEEPRAPRGQRCPIDDFLTSLAFYQADDIACVILSGTGSDGTRGVRAVKESGGLALAQADAQYDGMMRSAVATGMVDHVLPVEDMPQELNRYFTAMEQPGGRGARPVPGAEHLARIHALLRAKTGHDFGGYKSGTFLRRVQRRMHVLQIASVPEFIERLRGDDAETGLLFQDLLIGVTSFFRDPAAFAVLGREVIPRLFEGKGKDDTVRVWVAGCSTGEEAYSIAILLRECAPRSREAPKVQIFASDIDDRALEVARLGRYPASAFGDVPPDWLERYFLREDGTFRVIAELRECCLFSLHNLLRDPPFSRLDLISCRNLMIYLNADVQDGLAPLFHYALRPNGFLFLGTSENVTRHGRLFSTIDKTNRIFQRLPRSDRKLPGFPLIAPDPGRPGRPPAAPPRASETTLQATAERQVMDRYAPPFVVINGEGDVLHSSGRTGNYLELPPGAPDVNVFAMARTGLRIDMRAAVHRAATGGQLAVRSRIILGTNGGQREIDLVVQPMRQPGNPDPLYLVVFQEFGSVRPLAADEEASEDESQGATLRQMDQELRAARERLQTATEELESSNEELKSGNEELSSMNEELQAANEELETSKEELQSINEELQTVNAELNARVEELSRANSDMANLLESTQIPTLFLDRALAVKSFTPATRDLFHLVESDAGRPIAHVRARFALETLTEDAERVLRTLAAVEREVRSTDTSTRYVMRILPYRTVDNVISGVVITFTDITRISAAEARIATLNAALSDRIGSLETLLDLVPVGVLIAEDAAGARVLVNRHGARLLGDPDGAGLTPLTARFRLFEAETELAAEAQPLQRALRSGLPVPMLQGRVEREDGGTTWLMMSATPLFDEAGAVRGAIAALVDISGHREASARQDALLHELEHRVKNLLATITSLATRMARGARSVPEFQEAFLSRLQSMSRMHDLLAGEAWRGTDLRALVTTAVAAYVNATAGNVAMTGAELIVSPNAAATLGMILHELAINAAEYGAFSVPSGLVSVDWRAEDDRVRLAWRESGGPQIAAPGPAGFGTTFIHRAVAHELLGEATLDFAPDGVVCTINFPLPGRKAAPGA